MLVSADNKQCYFVGVVDAGCKDCFRARFNCDSDVCRGTGSLLKLVEPTGRGVWERESSSAVEMDPTCVHFDDMFRECLLAKIGLLICCHFVLSIVF